MPKPTYKKRVPYNPRGTKKQVKQVKKKAMIKSRAPLVETKQRVASDIAIINNHMPGGTSTYQPLNWRYLPLDDGFTNIPLESWNRNSHGFNDYNVVGQALFSKYLNFKMQLKFPQNETLSLMNTSGTPYDVSNVMIEDATKLFLICGWITQTLNYPLEADVGSFSLPPSSQATNTAINDFITQQLKPYFDEDEDKLQFRPKATTNIKIEKYARIAPNYDKQISTQAMPSAGWQDPAGVLQWRTIPTGSIPEVHKSHSWKIMKKIALTEGLPPGQNYGTDGQNLYPNNSWVPFAVIYNPDFEKQVAENKLDVAKGEFSQVQLMSYRWNDAHYFTDS